MDFQSVQMKMQMKIPMQPNQQTFKGGRCRRSGPRGCPKHINQVMCPLTLKKCNAL